MSGSNGGRPEQYGDNAQICVRTTGRSKLQKHSDRRAIVEAIIDAGGVMTLGQLDAHFEYSVRLKVLALVRSGWLDHCGDAE